MKFQLISDYKPAGDQPKAIESLIKGLKKGERHQTLLGVTGSCKTFTMANVIAQVQKPTLVIAPNKTLAAQLYQEYKAFFPKNRVCYFVSYYDYYQPEAYLPVTDTYIEKESMINEEIDRYRHLATSSLLTRPDVIVVASVSCIYNLGLPENYFDSVVHLAINKPITRGDFIKNLVKIGFTRNQIALKRGTFRVRGDIFEVIAASEEFVYRIDITGQKVVSLSLIDALTRKVREQLPDLIIFPPKHFVTTLPERQRAVAEIKAELKERLTYLNKNGLLLEAERLERRTKYDMEMLATLGYCHGVENYSRHLTGKPVGAPPDTLLSYFPRKEKFSSVIARRRSAAAIQKLDRHGVPRDDTRKSANGNDTEPDFLTIIDESHIAVPQIRGMYEGDQSRKKVLVEFGWRLPSALDNRPLNFKEFNERVGQIIFTSATPANYEREVSTQTVEQIVRPTGLVDPPIEVRPVFSPFGKESALKGRGISSSVIASTRSNPVASRHSERSEESKKILRRTATQDDKHGGWSQIDDVMEEAIKTTKAGERTLILTLTKKMSEELAQFLTEKGFRARFMHADTKTFERTRILEAFRRGPNSPFSKGSTAQPGGISFPVIASTRSHAEGRSASGGQSSPRQSVSSPETSVIPGFDILIGINLLREGLDLPEVSLVAILDADREGFLRGETALIQIMGRAARNVAGRVILYADSETDSMKRAIKECERRRVIQLAYNKKHGITPQTIKKEIREM